MTILASDIKLFESEYMRDTSDGGGRMTGNEIASGEAGNVFPKVSRLDATYGRVNLRKIYGAVATPTLDVYAGAHAIITDQPDNERIGCLLFSTGNAFDTRTQARDRIESYVVAGPLSRMRLYGNQLIGQKAILCYQAESEPLPDVGSVLVLSVESGSVVSASQYVRITDVTHEIRTFTDGSGDFTRRVLTLKIGSALVQTFAAGEVSRLSTDTNTTKVRVTQVADASKYYGLQPITEAADISDLTLRLASVYAPLVPSTNRETGVSLAEIANSLSLIACTDTSISLALGTVNYSPAALTTSYQLPTAVQPGSLKITAGASVFEDINADGSLTRTTGTLGLNLRIDYFTGTVFIDNPTAGTGTYSATNVFIPAANFSAPSHTHQIQITLSTRGSVYTTALNPLPAPGTTMVDFRVLGKWYRLRDNGAGELVANDPSEGTGSVNYTTGALAITLGALPDIDSSILISWGSPVHTTIRARGSSNAGTTLDLTYSLDNAPIVPGSFTASYPVNAILRNATDSGGTGAITGTGVTGTINYATGAVVLKFTALPDTSAVLSNAYTWRDGADLISTSTTAVISGGAFTVPAAAPFRNAGTMVFQFNSPTGGVIDAPAYINSAGQVRVSAGAASGYKWADAQVGTFAASTGVVTMTGGVYISKSLWYGAAWNGYGGTQAIIAVTDIAVERDTAAFDPGAVTGEAINVAEIGLTLDLTTTVADAVIPKSIVFSLAGKTYHDRDGTIYSDFINATGSAIVAGGVNYSTGVVTLTYWGNNTALSILIYACLTQYGDWTATDMYFRTSGSPIRPASLYIQATSAAGELLTGTTDSNGVISGTKMRGSVEQTMGVVALEFGEEVSTVWTPIEIMPSTLRYSCVVITNLPLDPVILGLDPVRLPSDGRVPIYRPGDIVVIHHTVDTALTNPVVSSTTYTVGRINLATLALYQANGTAIASDRYTVDLAAGGVTMAADWDGTGIAQPLVARHRIEDMSVLSDVQINGQIDLSGPLTHAYPANESYVSSALLFGDMQAVVTALFDQATWTSVWSDVLIGSQATAQFNNINYPITVLNESAVTERWRINFTSSTAFQIIGENLGVIGTGTTTTATTPINPVTGDAYFSIPALGWGSGWATGNQLRFNTIGATAPIWIARTILSGATLEGDSFDMELRGDVD